jgi:hypothetical protein
LQPADAKPVCNARRVLKNLGQKRFVVASQEDRISVAAALDQEVDRRSRVGAAVDVVAEKNACCEFDLFPPLLQ